MLKAAAVTGALFGTVLAAEVGVTGEARWDLWIPLLMELGALVFFAGMTLSKLKVLANDVGEIKAVVQDWHGVLAKHGARLDSLEREVWRHK